MNGFERRKEQSKEKIRQAALDLFKLYGFEQVTITHIARKADVSQVTIYNHFGSKEELVRGVIRMVLQDLLEKHRVIIYGDGTFVEKLERIIIDRIEMVDQYQGELARTWFQCDAKIQQMVKSVLQQELDHLVIELFNEGKRSGYIKPDLSDDTILTYYEILRRGILSSNRIIDAKNKKETIHELVEIFLHGMVEKKDQYALSYTP